jgi:hypothetical protein
MINPASKISEIQWRMVKGLTVSCVASDVLYICDLHDPLARYAGLGPLRETKVEVPEVQDVHGMLIHP